MKRFSLFKPLRLFAAVALLFGLSACGVKGALYFPEITADTPVSESTQPLNPAQ